MSFSSDTKSGLTAAVRASQISLSQAEQTFLQFVKEHTPPKQCPLAGNSVHADKKFLDKYMPLFMNHLHYRIVDVSTIKELCRLDNIINRDLVSVKCRQLLQSADCRLAVNCRLQTQTGGKLQTSD